MPRKLYLIGGGPGALLALRRHVKRALSCVKAKSPLVAYVGAASGDHMGFMKMLSAAFLGTGAKLKMAKLASPRADVDASKKLLEESDAVFVSGGDVQRGVEVIRGRRLVPFFRKLADEKPFIGISAGSLMLAKEWVAFPDDDDAKAHPFECLGVAPIHVDAHSEEDDWSELRTLVGLLAKRGDPEPVGYGLTKKGALCVHVDGDRVDLEAVGTDIPRVVVRRGKPVVGAPLRAR